MRELVAREPVPIVEPKQLVVEGQDAIVFFEALLSKMGLTEIQLQNFGGVDELRGFLSALQRQSGFGHIVTSVGIVRDAERDATSAFQSACSALQNSGLNAPDQPEEFDGSDPRVGVLILPDAENAGMLETLCLRSVISDPGMQCVEEYFDCIDQQLPELPKNMDKAKVQAFLASRPEQVVHLGLAAHKGYWQWGDPAFDHVKRFLSSL
jgi:hypothetical protein